jgi:hypothetical protein
MAGIFRQDILPAGTAPRFPLRPPDDLHGSTYLVDKPWVDRIIAGCLASGTRAIRPSRRR